MHGCSPGSPFKRIIMNRIGGSAARVVMFERTETALFVSVGDGVNLLNASAPNGMVKASRDYNE